MMKNFSSKTQSLSLLFAVVITIECRSLFAQAPEVREVVENGVKYKETRQVIRQPIIETKYEDQQQTIQRQKIETEYQPMVRTYQVPVTEWVLEPHVVNRWNPFATPYIQYQYAQRTRWETKQESVQVPVLKQKWVPETVTVQVPKVVHREKETVITSRERILDRPITEQNNTMLAKNPGFSANGSNAGPLSQQTDPRVQEPRMASAPRQPAPLPNQPAGSVLAPNQQPNTSGFGGAPNNSGFSIGSPAPPPSTLPGGGFAAPNAVPPANAPNLPQGYPR